MFSIDIFLANLITLSAGNSFPLLFNTPPNFHNGFFLPLFPPFVALFVTLISPTSLAVHVAPAAAASATFTVLAFPSPSPHPAIAVL